MIYERGILNIGTAVKPPEADDRLEKLLDDDGAHHFSNSSDIEASDFLRLMNTIFV